ncbi:MAG: hypothetical protein Q7R79_02545, partial [bacterium]|nr:hypothetical protein [bacterium]
MTINSTGKQQSHVLLEKDHVQSFSWGDLVRAYWYLLGDFKWRYLALESSLFLVNFYWLVPPYIIGLIVDFFVRY